MPTGAPSSAVVLALLLGSASGSPLRDAATRAIDVVVTDAAHAPVSGLSAADFDLTEDGRPLPIETCTAVTTSEGRTYLLAVDAFHLSQRGAVRVQPALEQFIGGFLGPRDRAAVAWLGPLPRMSDFTSDRQTLQQAIGATSSSARSIVSGSPLSAGPIEFGETLDSTARTFALLGAAIGRSPHVPGRRLAVLLISEGVAVDDAAPRTTADAERAFFAGAARANVSVYPIDPLGMSAVNASIAPSEESEPYGLAQWDSLRRLAERTGGVAVVGRSDLSASYRQIVQDNSSYYVITYKSARPDDPDGHLHNVRVKVRRGGVTVRARKER